MVVFDGLPRWAYAVGGAFLAPLLFVAGDPPRRDLPRPPHAPKTWWTRVKERIVARLPQPRG